MHTVYNGTEMISLQGRRPRHLSRKKSLYEFKSKIKQLELLGCTYRHGKLHVNSVGFIEIILE